MWLGVDTGGTFTDFVLLDGQALRVHKVLSTPQAPEEAILRGIRDLGLSLPGLRVVHGSTVATNAVLERKGVRTVYIANRGLRDVLTLGRQARRELYDLQPEPQPPPVPRALCLEVGARLGADGMRVGALDAADREAILRQVADLQPAAVAINLLYSFLDGADERTIASWLPGDLFVALSSEVLPEYREYERGIATWLTAWVGPLVAGYLERLGRVLRPATVTVMQSSGGTIGAEHAGRKAVHLLLSGPAGGLMGARFIGRQAGGESRLLTFDMGGTSTDVALIEDDIRLTSEGRIGPWPVAVPMVDMHTIGAGGGSIAMVDSGGLLQVGPESAGAAPGPACYGQGGTAATVTDANLVLGRLRPEAFLGGAMTLDTPAAVQAVTAIAARLGLGVEEAAAGIIRIANEHMVQALRVISVQRGVDPREHVLVSFGGAGGLHVCALAEALGMHRALVPVHAGVLSALGMLVAPRARQLSRTRAGLLAETDEGVLQEELGSLAERGRRELIAEGVAAADITADFKVDLRYQGQTATLTLPWKGVERTRQAFHEAHERRYGHRLGTPVELVNIRASLHGRPPDITLPKQVGRTGGAEGPQYARLAGYADDVPVWRRGHLQSAQLVTGPALITETVATTYLPAGWCCRVDETGNLRLEVEH